MDLHPKHLQQLIDQADLDGALIEVAAIQRGKTERTPELSEFERTRLACLRSEILDYGGRYDDSQKVILPFVKDALDALKTFNATEAPLTRQRAQLLHQFCYVIIHAGMCIYRHANYRRTEFEKAREFFDLSKRGLLNLERMGFPHFGALSRAWYCSGLVDRELYEYADARAALARSIEIAAKSLMEKDCPAPARYRFGMSRCYGLGNAWISYTEASLSEAQCNIVASRLLLRDAKAQYIDAYVELVNAAILLSATSEASEMLKAIDILKNAYGKLGGDDAVENLEKGHGPYAIRVANELAAAHLRYGLLCSGKERVLQFETALAFVQRVMRSVHAQLDSRTTCKAYIIESRIHRAAGQFDTALKSAQKALDEGRAHEFSRIDCWLTLGEAKYYTQDYDGAIEAFNRALEYGYKNRKIFAVCHLHLSRAYLASREPAKARFHFNTWDETKRALENAFVRALKDEVVKGLEAITKDFTIPENVSDLNSDVHLKALRKWLANTALLRTNGNYKAAAGLLHLQTEATIKTWQTG